MVFADLHEVHGSSTLKGDLVAVLGTVFYSFSNIGQEVMVKGGNTLEYLGMIGIFGSIIGGIQLFCFQYEELLLVSSESVVSATNSALIVIQFSRSSETWRLRHFCGDMLHACSASTFCLLGSYTP